MAEVSTSLSRARVEELLSQVPSILAGRVSDPTGGFIKELLTAVGVQALTIIKTAFLVKSRGGTDDAGIKWQPLSRSYVAYGRRHPGLESTRKAAKAKGRPLLTEAQDKLWRGMYAGAIASGLRHGMTHAEASGMAAGRAWNVVKAQGGKTILGEYGGTDVEILRDTGRLYNSLSPENGQPSGSPAQRFDVEAGRVTVGSNLKYAGYVHKRRPLWPQDGAWPEKWTNRLSETVADGVGKLLERMFT